MHSLLAVGAALLWTSSQAAPINGQLPQDNVFDYVIVGGGASSLTVANRLTENPDITVLIIEAGNADNYEYQIMIPTFQGAGASVPGPAPRACGWFNWCDNTVAQTNLNNRIIGIPQGKGLGGGTLINGLLWNRGDQDDFNDWASLGNDGWDWNSMLPYFQRSETFNPENNPQTADYYSIGANLQVHGTTGPQNVSFPNYFYNASHYIFEGMKELNVPVQLDPNDGLGKGAMFLPEAISSYNQSRADARRARYDPVADRPNFYVQTGQTVHRILWDTGCAPVENGVKARALGVEASPSAGAATWTAVAKREVIMAAGALRTPQVLELSGVGSTPALQAGGVQQKINLPGVGNNLQDHALMQTDQVFNNPDVIYTNIFENDTINNLAHTLYYSNRTGPYCFGPPNGNAFLSLPQFYTGAADLASEEAGYTDDQYLPPNSDATVVEGYRRQRPLLNKALSSDSRAAIEYLNQDNGQTQISNMRPFTRGTTHIASNDPFRYPALDYRYIANPVDFNVLLQALHFNDALFNSQAVAFLQPMQRSPAQHANDDDLGNFIRGTLATEYHPAGTAAMLPLEAGGVVDPNMLLYYATNVRVIDGSVQPMVVAAHLQSVIYAVAEKAADLIKAAQTPDQAVTPKLPLDTTSCNAGAAAGSKRDSVPGPHAYPPAPVQEKRQAAGSSGKYGDAPPAPPFPGAYPNFNAPPRAPRRPGEAKAASEGMPEGAALRWADALLARLPDIVDGVVGGVLGDVGGLLTGQGPIGL